MYLRKKLPSIIKVSIFQLKKFFEKKNFFLIFRKKIFWARKKIRPEKKSGRKFFLTHPQPIFKYPATQKKFRPIP